MRYIEQALEELGNEFVRQMIQELKDNGSYGDGDLANSIKYTVREKPNSYQLIRSMLTYGDYVDQGIGRGPGKRPPVEPIKNWIKQKRISVPVGLTVDSFAWAIAGKIAKKGTDPKPRPFIAPAINQVLRTKGEDLIGEAAADQALDSINQLLKR